MNGTENAGSTDTSTLQQPVIDIQSLNRHFRSKPALVDVNLSVNRGGVLGLVGLNGAGKTTLIKHLIGALAAQTGSVRIFGQDPTINPEQTLRRIGYMTEEDSLPSWLTVKQLIDYGARVYPSWDHDYAGELCDSFQLPPRAKLQSLSKGVRARAGLLVAIAHRPELLILDEPSSGLDPIARRDILEAVISNVADSGRTVLFSSHLLDEVARVCDRIAIIRNGRLDDPVTMDSIEQDYVETVFQSNGADPPRFDDAVAVSGGPREWSVVHRTQDSDLAAQHGEGLTKIETRPMTLERFFAAKAGGTTQRDSDSNSELDVGSAEKTR